MSSRNKVYGLEGRYRGTLTVGTRTKENTVICYLRKVYDIQAHYVGPLYMHPLSTGMDKELYS